MPKAPIPFRAFNEHGEVRIYDHGILPHWRQADCTYFVTFRLADSIPKRLLQEIEYERTRWLQARGIDPEGANWRCRFATLPTAEQRQYERLVERLVDTSLDECHGCCALRHPAVGKKVAAALEFFHGSRVLTGDFVIMPNHVHVLLTPSAGFELEDILHSIKSYTANQINRALDRTGRLWQRESYDHILRDPQQLEAYQQYIAANPTKAKLAVGQYILSHAEYVLADP
jgi:putative transposase